MLGEGAGPFAVCHTESRARKVLHKAAPACDGHHLHPAADPEHRESAVARSPVERDLGGVAIEPGAIGRLVRLVAVASRIDVGAAGDHDAVEALDHSVDRLLVTHRRNDDHRGAGALESFDVRTLQDDGVDIPRAPGCAFAVAGDPDDRLHGAILPDLLRVGDHPCRGVSRVGVSA